MREEQGAVATAAVFTEATCGARKGFKKIYIYLSGVNGNCTTHSEDDASKALELCGVFQDRSRCQARSLSAAQEAEETRTMML
jgi:hypothetical protein